MEGRIAVVDLADELRVRKQRIFKVLDRLGIHTSVGREFLRRGQRLATISQSEAAKVRMELARANDAQAVAGTSERLNAPAVRPGR